MRDSAGWTDGVELQPLALGEADGDVCLLDVTRLENTEGAASRFLTPVELAEYAELRHPLRRREWLGARICLKTMLLRCRRVGDPLECAIVKDLRGRPRLFSCAPASTASELYDCSLSHKGRFAGACVARATGTMVGFDIEAVSPRLLTMSGAFANDRDVLISAQPTEERLAILWALKEACAKAVGSGLGMALRDVICQETGPGRHRVVTADGLEFRARHIVHDGYVVALCVRENRPAGA
ncbi:MAG: hypothetical protein DMD96_08150 [Candidatus Rokuibacteriota bacterium]|nr:MAG: hypothetical protein DMD96_08150 [Candidatus Rokubacteria bacterium]